MQATGHALSNPFRVRDLDAFLLALNGVAVEVLGPRPAGAHEGRISLFSVDPDNGNWPTTGFSVADGQFDVDIARLVRDHIADGEVAVLLQAGGTRNREGEVVHVWGEAIAISRGRDPLSIDLNSISEMAAAAWGVTPPRAGE